MSENKQMAHPASVDSTPTSANQEDHVSMACHGARRLLQMTDNLAAIIGIEALAGALGVELRAPLETSPELKQAIAALRAKVPTLEVDRYMADDIATATAMIADGSIVAAISPGILPALEG
jgi:histidine ammonia-lyase